MGIYLEVYQPPSLGRFPTNLLEYNTDSCPSPTCLHNKDDLSFLPGYNTHPKEAAFWMAATTPPCMWSAHGTMMPWMDIQGYDLRRFGVVKNGVVLYVPFRRETCVCVCVCVDVCVDICVLCLVSKKEKIKRTN